MLGSASAVALPLGVLWGVLTFASPVFMTRQNVSNIFLQSTVVGILALGTTVVLLCEDIDLSIGSMEGMGSVIAAITIIHWGLPWPLGVAAAVGVGILVGCVNGAVTAYAKIPAFITTLGTLGILSGLALRATAGQSIYGFPSSYQWLGQGEILHISAPVIITVALFGLTYFGLRFTTLGWHIYATGGNRVAASLVGIRTTKVRIIAFAFSGCMAGFAGVIVSARLNSGDPNFGTLDLLQALAAVVIGGTALTGGRGSVVGTGLGVLLIVTIQNGLNLLGVSPFWTTAVIGAMIVFSAILGRLHEETIIHRALLGHVGRST
jgi:ribose/xylose/arabinose/galactoside ABC-type transport system permease subunit